MRNLKRKASSSKLSLTTQNSTRQGAKRTAQQAADKRRRDAGLCGLCAGQQSRAQGSRKTNGNKGLQLASGADYVDIVGVTGSIPVLPTTIRSSLLGLRTVTPAADARHRWSHH
jgi:hypothetical protein